MFDTRAKNYPPPRQFIYSGPSSSEEDGPEDEVLRIDVSEDEIASDSPSPPPPRLCNVVVVPEGSWLATHPRLILPDARPPLTERYGRSVPPPSPPGDYALELVLTRLGPPVPWRKARFFAKPRTEGRIGVISDGRELLSILIRESEISLPSKNRPFSGPQKSYLPQSLHPRSRTPF